MAITRHRRRTGAIVALAAIALPVAAGCSSPLTTLGMTLAEAAFPAGGGEQGRLVAEVVEVDELQRRIRVTTDDGRTGTVIYDQSTLVVRDQQHYTVKTIKPGELVLIEVERSEDGHLYATRIDIQPREEPDTDTPPDDPVPPAAAGTSEGPPGSPSRSS